MRNRKINKIKVSITLIIILILLIHITGFGRYIYSNLKDRYLTSKAFYFSSDLLQENGATYEYRNWGGTSLYKIDIDLYSFENELLKYDEDLEYKVRATTTSTKVNCAIGSTTGTSTSSGTIYLSENNTEHVSIFISPKTGQQLVQGDSVTITVTAYTEKPYAKTISADFVFEIKAEGAEFEIDDDEYLSYATLKLNNTLDINTNVVLKFDPNIVRLDMNDEIYSNNLGVVTEKINGSNYINQIQFIIPRESSKNIKFYKVDKSQNYTNQTDIFEVVKSDV